MFKTCKTRFCGKGWLSLELNINQRPKTCDFQLGRFTSPRAKRGGPTDGRGSRADAASVCAATAFRPTYGMFILKVNLMKQQKLYKKMLAYYVNKVLFYLPSHELIKTVLPTLGYPAERIFPPL